MFLASLLGGGGDDGESDVAVEGEEPIYAGGGAVPHEGALRGAASHERVLAEKGSILSERKDAAYALRDVLLEASKSCAKGVFIDLRGSFSALDDEDLDVEMVQALLEGIAAAVAASPETADAVLASGRNCVALLLRLMEGEEMWVRLGAMEVLSNLLDARLGDTMKGILASPAGLQGIVDVLDDSREEVRNETILLLLILADHQEGKSYFAFAVIDRVLELVLSEGEGAVQDDCPLSSSASSRAMPSPSACSSRAGRAWGKCQPFLRPVQERELQSHYDAGVAVGAAIRSFCCRG